VILAEGSAYLDYLPVSTALRVAISAVNQSLPRDQTLDRRACHHLALVTEDSALAALQTMARRLEAAARGAVLYLSATTTIRHTRSVARRRV
jgi:hypothetical protein